METTPAPVEQQGPAQTNLVEQQVPAQTATVEQQRPAETTGEIIEAIDSADITVYERLNNTNSEAKSDFLNNPGMSAPHFEYANLDQNQVLNNLQTLADLKPTVDNLTGSDKMIAQILLDDRFHKNDFLAANIAYNEAKTPAEKAEVAALHKEANEKLYGKPDEDTFYLLLNQQLDKISAKSDSFSPHDQKIYDRLTQNLGDLKHPQKSLYQPNPETVQKFTEQVDVMFENFFKHLPEGKEEFTTQEACDIANEIIKDEIGEDATDYRAVMNDKSGSVSVNHESRLIKFPVERANGNFSRPWLKAILVHELGTHAFRAMNYEDNDVRALSHELPNNEEIDEGIAKCCEQVMLGETEMTDEPSVAHYIDIGLATFKGKNFREVFDIQRDLAYLSATDPAKPETDAEADARFHSYDNKAYERARRCFRGTGELPNNKDLAYYNGKAKVWQYIEKNIDNPDLFDSLFLSGKSNIFDSAQQQFVYETKVG